MSVSLNSALFMATNGLQKVSAQMSVTSANITNADTDGYSKKTYVSDYVTTSEGTYTIGGDIEGTVNKLLQKTVIAEAGTAGAESVKSSYLDYYSSLYGDTSGDTGLGAAMNNFAAAISSLQASPDDESLKSQVVAEANSLASSLRSQSGAIQTLRTQADQDIETTISSINDTLSTLQKLNSQITSASVHGADTADLIDQRNTALDSLSGSMGIQYYFTTDNQVKIYSESGDPLLDDQAHLLSHESSGNLNSSETYPGGISGIQLDGKDVTTSLTNGKLGGLVALRDNILTGEQQKLDGFANTLSDTMNSLTNSGASFLPRPELVGSTQGMSLTDGVTASGTVRIALTNSDGGISSSADISLSGITTMQDLVDTINSSLPGATASLNADGKLLITSNDSNLGVAVNELDSAISVDGATSGSFSSYFGLNDMFTGSGAGDMQVASYLNDNASYLTTGTLTSTGVSKGDGSITDKMNSALTQNTSFGAAGSFGTKKMSFSGYVSLIISDAATQAKSAADSSDNASFSYNTLKTKLTNETGVNLDEETANMLVLQNAYSSNATVITTVRSMFEALLDAVN